MLPDVFSLCAAAWQRASAPIVRTCYLSGGDKSGPSPLRFSLVDAAWRGSVNCLAWQLAHHTLYQTAGFGRGIGESLPLPCGLCGCDWPHRLGCRKHSPFLVGSVARCLDGKNSD
ncbi:hypothetical protein NQZ68_001010 [Dissostichus eleginoides]|nr:hypothetical protein NQZ68_001010 [Dissostichus eleginoides]